MKIKSTTSAEMIDALASMLVPVARTLIRHDLAAKVLTIAAKLAFVRAAVQVLDKPSSRANISRLSVVTGMTRKEIAQLLSSPGDPISFEIANSALEQRAFRVLRGWASDPRFLSADGIPTQLETRRGKGTFDRLVRAYGGDVTPVAVLKELQRLKAVTCSRSGKIKLSDTSKRPPTSSLTQIAEFASLIKDFASVARQAAENSSDAPAFLGFADSSVDTPSQAALFHRTYARRATALLDSMEQWRKRQRTSNRQKRSAQARIRVGLGIYLMQSDPTEISRIRRLISKKRLLWVDASK